MRTGISVRHSYKTPFNRIICRWFDWNPRVTKKDGKPAFTGSKHAYVAAEIPVVLLRDVKGLGSKGSIVEVKRGFARNFLVPNGDAVFGTLWENIDSFADPDVIRKQDVALTTKQVQQSPPFDWLNGVEIDFLRDTSPTNPQKLIEPVTIRELLNKLSEQEELDLLPSQLEFPGAGIAAIGRHSIPVTLHLSIGTLNFKLTIMIRDRAEVAVAERREAELREAMKIKRPEFVLGTSRLLRNDSSEGVPHDTHEFTDSDSENE